MLFEEFIYNAQWMRDLYKECAYNSILCDELLLEKKIDVELSEKVKSLIDDESAWEINEYDSFLESVSHSKRMEFLTKYTKDELVKLGIKTFKLKDYKIGFALKPVEEEGEKHCEIISLHNNEDTIGNIGDSLIQLAIKKEGDVLNHFDGFFSDLYKRNGFSIIYWSMMFNDKFADPKWNYDLYGRPQILSRRLKKIDKFVEDKELKELDIFDFDNIPLSELDKAYIDYEPLYDTVDLFSLDEDYVYEEKERNTEETQSAVDVVNHAMSQLKMLDFQIKTKSPNGVDYIEAKRLLDDYPDYLTMKMAMLIPDLKKNVDIITSFMDENGYFEAKGATYKDKSDRNWLLLIFDPKKQESIKEMVLKYHKYAYHTSPSFNADSIERDGILAKYTIDPFASNTKRVYLYLGNTDNPQYVNMMKSISRKIQRKNKSFTGDFVEYEIVLQKLPDDIEFYVDIHGYGKDYIYTESDIPIASIRDSEDKTY